ncbi:MAG: ABC transporter substrate-binding protein [Alphaproteobacteria bacterium]|nr:ABC transporter substrate-binding protein [Alphaproteobacteria bacterium]
MTEKNNFHTKLKPLGKKLKNIFSFTTLCLALSMVFTTPSNALECETGLRAFTHADGDICIPNSPQRIVTLNDQLLALPLIELGAPLVGTAGRIASDGSFYMRGGMDTLGVDFSNSKIEFVGKFNALDLELIVGLKPDLIIGGTYNDEAVLDQLSQIAPVVKIDNTGLGLIGTLKALADITGTSENFEARYANYVSKIERLKNAIGNPEDISVTLTFMFPAGEDLWVYREGLGAIGQVTKDLGFKQPDAVASLTERQAKFSAETIESLDADLVFGFYRQSPDATAKAVFAAYEKFNPAWCAALKACQQGQFILLPSPTFGSSLTSLELAVELVETHTVGRSFNKQIQEYK